MRPPGIAVTGMGCVSPLGLDYEQHFQRLYAGEAAIGSRRLWSTAGQARLNFFTAVDRFVCSEHVQTRMLRKVLRPWAAFAVAAARQALRTAGLEQDRSRLRRAGAYFGSSSFDLPALCFQEALDAALAADECFAYERFAVRAPALVDPLIIVKGLPNAALCGVAIENGLEGPNLNLASGASGGAQAVLEACAAIRAGEVELAVAGGADSLVQLEHALMHKARAELWEPELAPEAACRPFGDGRGCLLGEGAGVVVLESMAHALGRDAPILATLEGWADAACGNLAAPHDGLKRAAERALAGAGATSGDIDAVFLDGLGTAAADERELQVARRLFPEGTHAVATTPSLGNTGSARGVFSLLSAVRALGSQQLPPTLGVAGDAPHPFQISPRAHARDLAAAAVWCSDGEQRSVSLVLRRASARSAHG